MNQNYGNSHEKKEISKPVGCLIALGFLWIAFMFLKPFISALIHMYNDSPTRGKAIFLGVILLIISFTTVKIIKLYQHMNKI